MRNFSQHCIKLFGRDYKDQDKQAATPYELVSRLAIVRHGSGPLDRIVVWPAMMVAVLEKSPGFHFLFVKRQEDIDQLKTHAHSTTNRFIFTHESGVADIVIRKASTTSPSCLTTRAT
jgi:hypothetical protein